MILFFSFVKIRIQLLFVEKKRVRLKQKGGKDNKRCGVISFNCLLWVCDLVIFGKVKVDYVRIDLLLRLFVNKYIYYFVLILIFMEIYFILYVLCFKNFI